MVAVFVKEPREGRVKTRLGRSLGMEHACALAWAFLEDVLAVARTAAEEASAELWVVHAPDRPSERFRGWLEARAPSAQLVPQGAGSLGERLARALGGTWGPRLALGGDAPDLAAARLLEAFAALAGREVVLGPTSDGGYHLVGLGAGVPASFLGGGIRWSSPRTLEDTLAAAREAGLDTELLAPHDDVDDLAGLRALASRLRAGAHAPASARWLAEHVSLWRSLP